MPKGKVSNQGLIAALLVLLVLLPLPISSTQFTAGDVAPYGNPDGQLTLGDAVVLQRFLNGSLTPATQEQQICDVAPIGNVNGVLDAGDLLVLQRAILGLVMLPPVNIGPDAPVISTASGSTNANPFTVNGTALPNMEVRLYVNGILQTAISADATGNFTLQAALYDGSNSIFATAWDGQFESEPSASISIDYTNSLNRNIGGSGRISSDTVWTPGVPPQPYTVTKILTVQPGVTLTIMPGAEIQFKPDTGLDVEGQLVIRGEPGSPVLLKGDASVTPANRWNGIQTLAGASGITIDYAEIELARYGVLATDGAISITNSIFREIDNPVTPSIDVDVIGLSGNVMSAVIADNQLLGTVTNNDRLAGIHVRDINAVISGNRIDGFDNAMRVGTGANPTIGPSNTITSNINGIRIEPLAGSNDDPHPTIFNNSIHSNSVNLHAGAGFDDPAVWWIDAQTNWWGSADPVDIAASIHDYSDVSSLYDDNIPSVDFTAFLDAPGGNETTGNYLFGRITSDKTLATGSNYIILGKLAIAPNVTLTIDEAVDLQFVPEASLLAYGDLSAVGSLGNLVRFSGVDWNPGLSWGGIQAMAPDLDILLDYVEIERATGDGLYFSRGEITNSYIHDNGTGIRVYWEAGPSLYGESITIRDNVIRDNAINGVSVNGVQGCDNCGPGPYIQENVITGSQHGLDIRYAGSHIKGNIIRLNDVGIHAFSFALNNFIYITHTGGGTFIGKGNEISGNNTGIKFTGGANSSFTWVAPSVSGHNDIFNNALYNIELAYTGYASFSTAYVNSHDNWWGTSTSTEIAATIRDAYDVGNSQPIVDYVPFKSTGPGLSVPVIDYETVPVAVQSYTVGGFAPPGATVQIVVNGIAQSSTVADAGGLFSATIQLAAGRNEIYSLASDGVNTSNPSEPVYLDYFPTTFPPAPALNPAVATTTDNPFRISGLNNPDAVINIYVNGLWQDATVADGNGLFSYLARLRDGQNSLFVTEDSGGTQVISTNTLVVDYVNNIPRNVDTHFYSPAVWTVGNGDPYVFTTPTPTITPGASLYIEEGVVVEFPGGVQLNVDGELIVRGTPNNPVIFTSANGTQSFDQWQHIEVRTGGVADIAHAVVEYSSKGIWFNGGAGTVADSLIRKNRIGISTQDDGGPITIQTSLIKENETGIAVGRSSFPQITDQNAITNNTQYGIGVTGTALSGEDPAPITSGNNIHGNTLYDYRATQFADPTVTLEAGNNWWNTPDPVVVAGRIYDQADNPSDSPTVNVAPLQPVSVDTQRPTAPVITGCSSPTDQPDCLITGTAEPGRDIRLYVNGVPAGTTTADGATGAFSLTGTLVLPGANLIQASARNGALESALSNTLVIVLDSAPPVITLTQPDPGGVANYAVIAGQLDEPAIVTVAGESATVFADNSFAHALTGLANGMHTIQIIATDGFGQNTTTSVTFTLDTQPPAIPDTGQISVGTPTGGQVSISAASGSATVGDTVTLLNSRTGLIVQGAVQGDGSYSIQIAAEAGDVLVITITDTAGNTTASRILTVAGSAPALGVSISTPSADSTIYDDTTGVTGTFQGPANVGIVVNGYTANKVGDAFCVGDIPLQAGSNILTVTARTPDVTSSSQQVTVNSTGPGPLQLEVDRTSGTAPLTVTFSLTDNTGLNLNIIDYDVDGDGTTDYSDADPAATVTQTYTTPGCYIATVTAQESGLPGSVSSSRVVAVTDPLELEGQLLGIWYTFLQRLRSNDAIGALDLIYEPSRSKYTGVYNDLQADMPIIVDALGTAELSAFGDTLGELIVTRNNDGFPEAYMIYLIRTPYGTWQIEGM